MLIISIKCLKLGILSSGIIDYFYNAKCPTANRALSNVEVPQDWPPKPEDV